MEFPEIPGYKIQREIGSGGMATVFLALQESLHREVALKVMVPGRVVDETSCHRFLKEGRIAAQLNHRNLLTVYDIGVHEDHYYMASEYLPGGTARDKMKDGLSDADVAKIISDIARGLSYAHSKGFVHRDVKPGNLLYRANGDVVLGDFGIAKSVDSTTAATKIGTSVGTPHYMSPEQAKAEKVDHRTDLYSLGVVFYELLTGKPPFDADDPFSVALMQIKEPVPDLPGKKKRFQPLIEKLMAKDREERYESADAFLADLEKLIKVPGGEDDKKAASAPKPARSTGAEKPARQESRPAPKPRARAVDKPRSGSSVLLWLAVVVVVAAAGGGGWYWYQQQQQGDSGQVVDRRGAATGADSDVRRAEQIETLLADAREHIAAGRFFSPPDDNAYASYQQVLRLEVTNDDARDGLQELVKQVERSAEELWQSGNAGDAMSLLREGLRRFPADPRLRQLLTRIESEESGVEDEAPDSGDVAVSRSDLDTLLLRAERHYGAGDYSQATKLYQQVLGVDPNNAVAEDQLRRIAENWAIAAQNFLQQGDLQTAAEMIEKGLQAKADHPRLLALRERLQAMQEESEDQP